MIRKPTLKSKKSELLDLFENNNILTFSGFKLFYDN